MKKQFTLILILVTSFFFNTYSQSLANTTWSVYKPDNSFFLFFHFTADSIKYGNNTTTYTTISTYTAVNSNLTVLDLPGGGCFTYVGQYTFAVQGNTLSLVKVNDLCTARETTFTTFKWLRMATGVNELSGLSMIGMYPNPTEGSLTISLEGEKTIRVINYLGQMVKSFTTDTQTISLEDLEKGVYQINVLDKDHRLVASRKIIRD